MEDLITLYKRGVIYDGCPVVAKGTIRIKDGELEFDTTHDLMSLDGKNFGHLCDPEPRDQQGQLTGLQDSGSLEAKVNELTSEKEQIIKGMNKTVTGLKAQLHVEKELRVYFEDIASDNDTISESATRKLAEKDKEIDDLKSELDSTKHKLEENGEKITEIEQNLVELEGNKKEVSDLQDKISILEEQQDIGNKNTEVLSGDFNQWKSNAEEEINALRKELEKSKSTITSLRNELEIAELEDTEQQHALDSLQRENTNLKRESISSANLNPELKQDEQRKLRKRESLRNVFKGIIKPKDPVTLQEKQDKKDKKRSSVASLPT